MRSTHNMKWGGPKTKMLDVKNLSRIVECKSTILVGFVRNVDPLRCGPILSRQLLEIRARCSEYRILCSVAWWLHDASPTRSRRFQDTESREFTHTIRGWRRGVKNQRLLHFSERARITITASSKCSLIPGHPSGLTIFLLDLF